jgi:hypothetical protein
MATDIFSYLKNTKLPIFTVDTDIEAYIINTVS